MQTPSRSSIRHSHGLLRAGLLLAAIAGFGSGTLGPANPAHAKPNNFAAGFVASGAYGGFYYPGPTIRRPTRRHCVVKRWQLPSLNARCSSQQPGSYFSTRTCRCETLQ